MRVVIHAEDDFEPITVVSICSLAEEHIRKHHGIVLPCYTPPPLTPWIGDTPITMAFRTVFLRPIFVRLPNLPRPGFVLVTNNDESALLLRAAFLSGQRSLLQEHEKIAFARGFVEALQNFCERP